VKFEPTVPLAARVEVMAEREPTVNVTVVAAPVPEALVPVTETV
jgi:hypothetical protein